MVNLIGPGWSGETMVTILSLVGDIYMANITFRPVGSHNCTKEVYVFCGGGGPLSLCN